MIVRTDPPRPHEHDSDRADRRASEPPHFFVVELRTLRDDDEAVVGDEEPFAVGFEVEPYLDARRHLDVLVDDATAKLGMASHADALVEDALFDLCKRVHAASDAEHAPVNAAAGDDAPVADHRVRRDADASVRLVAEDEL